MSSVLVSAFVECFLIWSHPFISQGTRRMFFDMEGWLYIKKHSKNADTSTLDTTNHPQSRDEKTDHKTTYSDTTPMSAKTSEPISDTDSLP